MNIISTLSPERTDRFVRQQDFVPRERLANVSVTVIGVGAIGRQVALQLACLGVPRLTLVDFDLVEPTNVTTQSYAMADVGCSKVVATAAAVRGIDPTIAVVTIDDIKRDRQGIENRLGKAAMFVAGPVDGIVDRGLIMGRKVHAHCRHLRRRIDHEAFRFAKIAFRRKTHDDRTFDHAVDMQRRNVLELVGLPEAGLNLAQAVVHLATAPKSNRTTVGIGKAREAVRTGPPGDVPVHLRDAHYQGAAKLGHGKGYEYPHDDPRGWLPQQYLPDGMRGAVFYTPTEHGFEQEIGIRMERHRADGPDRADRAGNRHEEQR